MKKDFSNLCFSLAGLATIAVPQTVQADESLPYWKDIQVVSVNREEPRSAFMTYANKTQALTGDYEKSPYYQLLNGTWKFYYTDSYKQLPADVTEASPSEQGWQNITVPGNWEVQGFGTAIYTNHGYEFQPLNPKPPQLPENTPVGVYRRTITVPEDWNGRDIYLHIAGAKSGCYVYLNGKEVGYNEDSKNPVNIVIALILNMVWVYVVLKLTDRIERFLGKGGIYVIRKFFGIILLAISARLFTANLTLLIEQFQKAQ